MVDESRRTILDVTYPNGQQLNVIRSELRMFEQGIALPVRVNGVETRYTGEQNNDPEHAMWVFTRSLENGGRIAVTKGMSGPKYVYPDAPKDPNGNQYEKIEELDADIRTVDEYVPELAEWAEQHVGSLVAFNGHGLGQHHARNTRPTPTTFRAARVVRVENGKMVLDLGVEKQNVFPCISVVPTPTVMQPLSSAITDAFEAGEWYEVSERGVFNKNEQYDDAATWVVPADTWNRHTSWLRTDDEMTRDVKLKSDGVRAFNSDSVRRVGRYLYELGEESVGREVVVNDDAEPVEIVESEYDTGRNRIPNRDLMLADGRRLNVDRQCVTGWESVNDTETDHSFPVFSVKIADESAPEYARFGVGAGDATTTQATF